MQRTGADPAAPGERTWHTIFVDGEAGAGARSLAGVCAVRLGERGKVYRFRLSARGSGGTSPVVPCLTPSAAPCAAGLGRNVVVEWVPPPGALAAQAAADAKAVADAAANAGDAARAAEAASASAAAAARAAGQLGPNSVDDLEHWLEWERIDDGAAGARGGGAAVSFEGEPAGGAGGAGGAVGGGCAGGPVGGADAGGALESRDTTE